MSNSESNFRIMLQAMLDKVKSMANIKSDIKAIEPKLPKIRIQGKLDKTATQKELTSKIKTIRPKVNVDADTTQAEKEIKKIGKQKNKTTITPTVDNSHVVSGLKQAQKETKTLWERFTSGITGVNIVRMAVQHVTQAIREAIVTVKELGTIKTDIQMVSGASDSDVNAMMSSYNTIAKGLSSTTRDVAEAANEFLRMGESVQNTNELIRSSQILSKVGMIESTDAASYLISSLKGYKVAAEDSLDIVSKLTSVDLEAAVSTGGLSEALSKCANIANNSGVTMDRLIGYTATVGETTQKSMSEVGNSFQALLGRMNNIKIGRFIDDETGESLSDTEAVLNKLGIQLRDTENTYRSFDAVLDDIGSRWKELTNVEQNAISLAIAGTRQRENFEALMNNWGNALKYSETAANSAGSALERYGVYQDSIEAKTNELTAALESLSTSAISEELYSGIIEATTGLVEFIDKTNILKGALAGLVAMGVSKAIVSIGAGFITAAKSTAQLTAAMAMFDQGTSKQNLLAIGAACTGLSNQQLKLILSTKTLKYEDRELILAGMGVAEAEQKQMLATLGFAAAEDKATLSTFSLKGAWNALGTAFASNPIGFILTGITTIVSIATTAVSAFRQKQEEAAQAMQDAVSEYDSAKSSLESINSELDEQNRKMEELQSKDKLTYAEKGQLEELQAITKELLLQQDIAERDAERAAKDVASKTVEAYEKQYGDYDISEEALEYAKERGILSIPDGKNNIINNVASYIRATELLEEARANYEKALGNGEDTGFFADDVQFYTDMVDGYSDALDSSIIDLQEKRLALEDEYNRAIEKRESNTEPLTSPEQDVIRTYESIYDAMKLIYEHTDQNAWNDMEITNILNTADIEKTREELIAMAASGELTPETIAGYVHLNEAIQASELFLEDGKTAAEAFCDEIYGCVNTAEALSDTLKTVPPTLSTPTLSIPDTISQFNTRLKPTFDSLKSAYQDIFADGSYNPNAVDIPMLDSIRSSMEEFNRLEDVDAVIDMDAFDTLATTLADVDTTEDQARQAFKDFATSIFYATDATHGMSDSTKDLVDQLLESLGVVNHTEVAEYALLEARAHSVLVSRDLAAATEDEYISILAEGEAAGLTRQQLYNLTATEIAFGNNTLNTEQKIEQLGNLAKAYGDTANAALATAIANDLASGHTDTDTAMNDLMARINTGTQRVDIDFSPIEKSAAKAGSSAGKSYTDALKDKLSGLNDVINYIGDTIGDQIDLFNDQKDAAVDALEAEKEAAEDALEAEKESLQQKIDAKQAEIDAIEDAAKARKNELDLQKAQYDLERMQNQRTVLQYSEGKGMHYVTDTREIRDAREAVTEAKENIRIAGMEKEISGLDDTMDSLDRRIEESNRYYDTLIDQAGQYWDGLIKGLEDYRTRWQELADIEDQAMMEVRLRELGITTDDVLNMSGSAFESFRGTYLGLLGEMHAGNGEMLAMLQEFGGIPSDALAPLSGTIDTIAESLDTFTGHMGSTAAAAQTVSEAIDGVAGTDMGGPTGQFHELCSSVDNAAAAISGGSPKADRSGGPAGKNTPNAQGDPGRTPDGLVGSIVEVGRTTAETLGEPDGDGATGRFSEMGGVIADAGSHVAGIVDGLGALDGMTAECFIRVNVETTGSIPEAASGTPLGEAGSTYLQGGQFIANPRYTGRPQSVPPSLGSAHAEGTALVSGNWAVQSNEGDALVGEAGYEIVVRDGRFFTVGDNGPEMFPIRRGDIVFNHEQSRQLLRNGHASGRGRAYADGTVGGGRILTGDGQTVSPYNPDTDTSDFGRLYRAWNRYFGNMDNNLGQLKSITQHLAMENNRKMNNEVNSFISRSNSVVNSSNMNVQPVVNQNITLSCPNVTNSSGVEYLQRQINGLSLRAIQEPLRNY